MTKEQISRCTVLRSEGHSFSEIAEALGISRNTIKSYFKRHSDILPDPQPVPDGHCLQCGRELMHTAGAKHRKFCCGECRQKWWNAHPEMVHQKAIYSFVCAGCGKEFTAYGNAGRKYCSHPCYIRARFGGGAS